MAFSLLVRLQKWSGWALIPVIIIYLITGYSLAGRYGLHKIFDLRLSLVLHSNLDLLLIFLLILHVIPSIIFFLRRRR
ncbi:MAG: hypothetical protein DRP15_02160 [Candidatus Aenigmatarchaeota archaeon]|nr:MAG: hypothetical protein DRP15_02160 [Candidatus Aenigmarchaeota archaeon]